ncbi:MAG: xanthine dehydrogenase accessory protein XdhC [Comamonas sp.]
MTALQQFLDRLATQPACLVEVESTQGSVPREKGAWMAVFAEDAAVGTIGGGHLEWMATQHALRMLEQPQLAESSERYALGPSLGQCCGGVVHLRFRRVAASDMAALRQALSQSWMPVALFGSGHVGRALVQTMAQLPVQVQWIDSREHGFPAQVPENVQCEYSDPVEAAVEGLPSGSSLLVMSYSHQEDFQVLLAVLKRLREADDLGFVGVIGSRTKWQTFRHRMQARGFSDAEIDRITCPIGVPGVDGKEPEVIAVAVAAQLLQYRSQLQAALASA